MNEEATKEVTSAVEPVISPENITEEQIRAMAAEADGIPYKASSKANTEPEVADQDSQDASKTTPEAEEEIKDSDESAPKAEEKQEINQERKASEASKEEADKSEDSKKEIRRAKEEARLAESWKRLEAEKAQVRELQAQLQRVREEVERSNDPTNLKPDDLRKYAKQWDDEGRDDLAKAARHHADVIEKKMKDQSERQERNLRDFKENWDSNIRRALSDNPELADTSSPLAQKVAYILHNEDPEVKRLIHSSPNGIIYATQIARMMEAAEASEALRNEVEILRKENSEFRKKTSLSASSPSKAPKRKSFEEMSWQEQEEFLRRNASDADKLGVLIGD